MAGESEQLTRAAGRCWMKIRQESGSGESPENCRNWREAAGVPGCQTEPENFRRGYKNGAEQKQCEEVDRGGSKYQPLAGDFWLERKGEGNRAGIYLGARPINVLLLGSQ